MSDRLTQAQQRLQEMAKDYQPLVSAQSVREQRAEIRARADACDLGAQCVALVQQLATVLPWKHHVAIGTWICSFCGQHASEMQLKTAVNPLLFHADSCLWQQARQLTEGER